MTQISVLEMFLLNILTPAETVIYRMFPIIKYLEVPELEDDMLLNFKYLISIKTEQYARLIECRQEHNGHLPEEVRELFERTICGKMMLYTSVLRR